MFVMRVADGCELALLEQRHAELLAGIVDANRAHLAPYLPWAQHHDLDDARRFVAEALQKFARGDGFDAGLWVEGELAGMVGLHYIDHDMGRTELGYWLAGAYEGRGVMSRSLEGLLRSLFEEYGLNRLEIRCRPENARSRNVAERLGFKYEGTLRAVHPGSDGAPADARIYGLLRQDWIRFNAQRRERKE